MITDNTAIVADILRKEDVVAIPTETVYGLAGNAYSETAVRKIFELKNRPTYNPLIVHIKSLDFLEQVACDIPAIAYELAERFWPGPLTLLLKKKPNVPDLVTAGKATVAVRIPDQSLTLELLGQLDFPLAAPSANPFGSISPTSAQHVNDYFGDKVPAILNGGDCLKGLESTIIGFDNGSPVIYRLGALSPEELGYEAIRVNDKLSSPLAPEAPGMLSRHYAPRTKTYLTNDVSSVIGMFPGKRIGVLLFTDQSLDNVVHKQVLSVKGDLQEAGKKLYAALHELDKQSLDLIIAERLPDVGVGRTMNDRLQRAIAEH